MDDLVMDVVRASVVWLDAANGRDDTNITLRILKIVEEAGEAAAAWIGVVGNNPRKGITHTAADVAAELADVAITAMVAIESLGLDHREMLRACATKILERIDQPDGRAPAQ